jgi:hypothetical protein
VQAIHESDAAAVVALLSKEGECASLLDPLHDHDPSALRLAVEKTLAIEKAAGCDSDAALRARRVVQLLVDAGANLFGHRAMLHQVDQVVAHYVPAEDSDEDGSFSCFIANGSLVMSAGGSVPPNGRERCEFVVAQRLPLHLALVSGSLELVQLLCPKRFIEKLTIVLRLLHAENMGRGQWASLLAFVAWMRPHDAALTKYRILAFLVEESVDALECECTTPGCPASQYPLLHGLMKAREAGGAAAAAVTDKFVVSMVHRRPHLLTTYDRANRTAYVAAASSGCVSTLEFLERTAATLPPYWIKRVNLADPTAGELDFQDESEAGPGVHGVCVVNTVEDAFHPVKAIVAAAANGHVDAVSHLWKQHCAAVKDPSGSTATCRTKAECVFEGVPFTHLLVTFASRMQSGAARDAFCRALHALLLRCLTLGSDCLVDEWGNSPLHVAAVLQVPCVVHYVATALAGDLALVQRKNDRGLTARQVAAARTQAAKFVFAEQAACGTSNVGARLADAHQRCITAAVVQTALRAALSH